MCRLTQAIEPKSYNDMSNVSSGEEETAVHRHLAQCVQKCDYNGVISTLRGGGSTDASACLRFHIGQMTGLEYSVFRQDWRMASIFFVHGADPACNELASVLQMFDSTAGYENPVVKSSLDGNVPGFDGLRALVETDDVQSNAFLWMMEKCYKGEIGDLSRDFRYFSGVIETVYSFPVGRMELEKIMLANILGTTQHNFTHEAMKKVAGGVLLHMISDVLNDIAMFDSVGKDHMEIDAA